MPLPSLSRFLRPLLFVACLYASPLPAFALPQAEESASPATAKLREELLGSVAKSFVIVEIRLRQDRGDMPDGRATPGLPFEALVEEERPLELPGFLLDASTVLVSDAEVPERFVESVRVRFGKESVAATFNGILTEAPGVLFALASPLPGTSPLSFLPQGEEPAKPLTNIRSQDLQGVWTLAASAGSAVDERIALEFTSAGAEKVVGSTSDSVTVDAKGRVVRTGVGGRLSAAAATEADPRKWPSLNAESFRAKANEIRARADRSIVHVSLHFRSPRKTQGRMDFRMESGQGEVATEFETLGVVLEGGKLLVLANLTPGSTRRLERIEVASAGSSGPVSATFTSSLRDWGAFLATIDAASLGQFTPLSLSSADVSRLRSQLTFGSEVRIVGRSRLSDVLTTRPGAFDIGWQGTRFLRGVPQGGSAFLFAADGSLLSLPLTRREAPGGGSWRSGRVVNAPVSVLAEAFASKELSEDPSNVPLDEEAETRTGWLGVLMQPLEPELARANGVAELTRDGEFGGIVTFVYPNSPAAKAGLEPGMILLSLTTARQKQPIEITLDEFDLGWSLPWERLDELPEEAYDQIPPPWPPIDDTLNSMLTDFGIGSEYTLEYAADGKITTKTLTVDASPPHFTNAPKFEAKSMGLTVRDLTLEVRQNLGLADDVPGVIVSKLEPGERASVAGLKPFEIIESVDSQPVRSAAEFEAAIKDKNDLKFTVKRAQRERVVKVTLKSDGAAAAPAETP